MAIELLFYLPWLCFLLLGGCTAIDLANIDRPFSRALRDPADTALAMRSRALVTGHPGLSGFCLIDSGREALWQRLELADQAEKTLDLQYYILRSDIRGLLLVERLLVALCQKTLLLTCLRSREAYEFGGGKRADSKAGSL